MSGVDAAVFRVGRDFGRGEKEHAIPADARAGWSLPTAFDGYREQYKALCGLAVWLPTDIVTREPTPWTRSPRACKTCVRRAYPTTALQAPAVEGLRATAENVDQVELVYESVRCGRCGGSGRVPHRQEAGCCYGCGGTGRKSTAAGQRARDRFELLSREMLPTPLEEIEVGDRIWVYVPQVGHAWAEVTGRSITDYTEQGRANGSIGPGETWVWVRLDYVVPETGYTDTKSAPIDVRREVPRWDPVKMADIYNQVAKLRGATLRLRAGDEEDAR